MWEREGLKTFPKELGISVNKETKTSSQFLL